MKRLLVGIMLAVCGCSGAAVDDAQAESGSECERSAYELERTRYRCTPEGELQTLDCGEWQTLEVCETAEACSPGPNVGCM
jgi:hypothetical protein